MKLHIMFLNVPLCPQKVRELSKVTQGHSHAEEARFELVFSEVKSSTLPNTRANRKCLLYIKRGK